MKDQLIVGKTDWCNLESVMAAVCDPAGFTGVSRCGAAGLVLKSLFPGFRGGGH